GVELSHFGPGVDGVEPVALVLLPAGAKEGTPGVEVVAAGLTPVEGRGPVARADDPAGAVVTPRPPGRENTVELLVSGAGGGDLILSMATAGAAAYRPIASPRRAEGIEVSAEGWTAGRTGSAGMPVWRLSGGAGDAAVTLAKVVSDRPPGLAHLVLYSIAPGASGWAVVPVTLVEASVIIDSFTADVQTLNNLDAPAAVHLSWNTSNATTVTLSGVGVVDTTMTDYLVSVEQTTTFVLTAFDASLASIESKSVKVTVNPGLASRMVPAGTILVWSGALSDIPAGWALCDGTNGTPDLRDRFVMGAAGGAQPGHSGDADTHTHPVTITINATIDPAGAHTHGMPINWYARNLDSGNYTGIATCGTFNVNVQTQSAGDHTHTVPGEIRAFPTGVNTPGVRPPWFALAYIVKLPYATS
ncbi:MAG TPA: hypothetical protein VGV85_01955, partial [Longimicrobiaceae bacterium]|nr:hypothetical protein [Longimicrobiaceae bacterium]